MPRLTGPLTVINPPGSAVLPAIVLLTDNSGGVASDIIALVPGAYNQATLAAIVASLTRAINRLNARIN
jgi:hypothetical protein